MLLSRCAARVYLRHARCRYYDGADFDRAHYWPDYIRARLSILPPALGTIIRAGLLSSPLNASQHDVKAQVLRHGLALK